MATRNAPAPPADPPDEGFNETQLGQIEAMIAKAVGGAKPPAGDPADPPRVKPTDEQWDSMSDRQRETWVRQECDWWLQDLVKMDKERQRDADIEALKKKEDPEPEKPPSVVTKLQKFLWGSEPEKP